jgi:hypothetical protein
MNQRRREHSGKQRHSIRLIERTSNSEGKSDPSRVARFGTRLATGAGAPKAQLTEILAKIKVAERVGFEFTCEGRRINKLLNP